MISLKQLSSGLSGLDKIIKGLRVGDNVVWQVDDIEDYRHFVIPFVHTALRDNKKVVYIRFAEHEPLLKPEENIVIYNLDAHTGFEMFSAQVHNIVTKEGEDIYYVFDCLSDLLSAWATDLMIGNFFLIICPYLFELNTVAYFSILRRSHSYKTIARIHEITQVLLEVYNFEGNYYVHPLKAQNRYTPTMFLPHLEHGNSYIPIINSVDATRLFSYFSQKEEESTKRKLDYWDRLFLKAEDLVQGSLLNEEKQNMVEQLCHIMITREKRMLSLATHYFSLEDLLNIKSRLIGTGFIGGKAVGMLLARNVLLRDSAVDWQQYMEPHDSFYIGSDVFYSYIVQNGWWKLRMEQKTKEGYFKMAALLREKMRHGKFPGEIKEQFQQIIEYFGQYPIIVRSSSLLEDAFGNAFAGKYESIFCVNQGTPEERYTHFEEYVRRVFASAMNEDALTYRLQRGLETQDEQMAILVQRVSGSNRKHYFFPDLAGVGVSYNTFVWKRDMDPKAGMLRLVLGLGTRAVNRVENDYPRIIALDDPMVRPHAGIEDTRKFSQHEVDVLNIEGNMLQTVPLTELTKDDECNIDMELLGTRDYETTRKLRELGMEEQEAWVLTFDELLSKSPFASVMQNMLKKLESIYQYPVDIEFTVNFTQEGLIKVNLVQCRPLQTKGREQRIEMPELIENDKILFQSEGSFMGGSVFQNIRRIIFVDPESYHKLLLSEKYDIARLVGKLNKMVANRKELPVLLLGPGRWGTTTPSLGVSVRFSEINNVAVIGEISYISGSLMPELSFGTHFFQDLVESDIFYVALFPEKSGVVFNQDAFSRFKNVIGELVPNSGKYEEVVRVYDMEKNTLQVAADVMSQKVICFSNESLT